MFILALTSFGVSQRLLTYQRMADALARAAMTPPAEADKARIYKIPSVDEKPGGVSVAGLSRGVFVGAVETAEPSSMEEERRAKAARAQLLAAMGLGMLAQDQKAGK